MSIGGYPCTVQSDNEPQLVAANKELEDAGKEFDLNTISKIGSDKDVRWEFNKSSDGPWLNGLLRTVGDSVH